MSTRESGMEKGFWFTSEIFPIEVGEDTETNPLCFGKSLAVWLEKKLLELGYTTEIIPEDWGWCVMCQSSEYLLWVGCSCIITEEQMQVYEGDNPPKGSEVVWHAFSSIEIPFFNLKSLFKKWTGRLDLDTPLETLNINLASILKSEAAIKFCDEP